jgi:AraC-like DNA-binding protein
MNQTLSVNNNDALAAPGERSIGITKEKGVAIDVIEVWHPADLPQLELRRGFGVARPVPRHWHEEYQFCLIQSGSSQLEYRGTNYPTPPASLFMVHPGEVHSNRAHESSGCSYRTLFVDAELMRSAAAEVFGRESSILPFLPTAVTSDTGILRQYLNLHFAMEQSSSSLEREGLLTDLLASLISRFVENRPALRSLGHERQAVKLAWSYLMEHYVDNISLRELARIAGLSPFHFSRVFSEAFGMPPHSFQTQLRVSRAKALLRLGRSISEVACETGFADQSHLNRHFKRLVEPSPGRYRSGSKNVQYI